MITRDKILKALEQHKEQGSRDLERKENDPEGAIIISRTLVESVLKHILDERNIDYSNSLNENW